MNNKTKKPLSASQKRALAVRREKLASILTIIVCFVLPPVGICLVWRRKWGTVSRYSMTALATAVMAAVVFFVPTATGRYPGGVKLIGASRNAEVYGPELPENIIPGYVDTQTSVLVDDETEEIAHYYAAKGEKYYHDYNCSRAYASSQKLTAYEAFYLGYKPCPVCNPPEYVQP